MIAMIPIMGFLMLRPPTHTHRADIRQRGLRIHTQLQVPVTMDMGTTDLNTRVITGMAIMDLNTQVTMDIGITGLGINGQSLYCV